MKISTKGRYALRVMIDLAPIYCLTEEGECLRKRDCKTYSFWKGLDNVINKYIDSKTLEDLIK